MKVLIIEDNRELAENIQGFLLREGYVCELCSNHQDAQHKLTTFKYDCIILDIMLPDGNGLNLLQFIKSAKLPSSILIISASNSLDDKVAGLELGADDYLTKPFHLTELHARLKAIYRRKRLKGDWIVSFEEISVNTDNMEARVNNILLDLTKKRVRPPFVFSC